MAQEQEVVLFSSNDSEITLKVNVENDTVWLSLDQLAELFCRDKSTLSRHISNIYKEGELEQSSTVVKIATVQKEGSRSITRLIENYNLDMIISIGYRVKSQRGIEFRKWATSILKEYTLKGYVENKKRLEQLNEVTQIIERLPGALESNQILDVVKSYTKALDLLDDYDHQQLTKPEGNKTTYILSYDECREVIDQMRFGSESSLFGNEKDDSFKGSIAAIYQGFGGVDAYPSLEEKAANLLYFIVKNHSFSDGNKRIAAALFLYFLDKNNALFEAANSKRMADETLVAITIMIAESKPEEKETMVSLVMNFLV